MTKNDGGTAFPSHVTTNTNGVDVVAWQKGMTLRDYFAAKAMQAMVSNPNTNTGANDVAGAAKAVVGWAYQISDAMLAAREVKP